MRRRIPRLRLEELREAISRYEPPEELVRRLVGDPSRGVVVLGGPDEDEIYPDPLVIEGDEPEPPAARCVTFLRDHAYSQFGAGNEPEPELACNDAMTRCVVSGAFGAQVYLLRPDSDLGRRLYGVVFYSHAPERESAAIAERLEQESAACAATRSPPRIH